MTRGIENGIDSLKVIEAYEARRLEPELQCIKALWSPASKIVDTHFLPALHLCSLTVANAVNDSGSIAYKRCLCLTIHQVDDTQS